MERAKSRALRLVCSPVLFVASLLPAAPSGSCPPFEVNAHDGISDGMRTAWVDLKAPGVELRWFPAGQWVIEERPAPGVSVEMFDRRLPSLKMRLFLYPKGTWLSDFEADSMARHVASLEAAFPEAVIDLLNPGAYKPVKGSPPFLSGKYRLVFYRVRPANPEKEPFSGCDALTFTRSGDLLLLRIRGPERAIAHIRPEIGKELARFVEP